MTSHPYAYPAQPSYTQPYSARPSAAQPYSADPAQLPSVSQTSLPPCLSFSAHARPRPHSTPPAINVGLIRPGETNYLGVVQSCRVSRLSPAPHLSPLPSSLSCPLPLPSLSLVANARAHTTPSTRRRRRPSTPFPPVCTPNCRSAGRKSSIRLRAGTLRLLALGWLLWRRHSSRRRISPSCLDLYRGRGHHSPLQQARSLLTTHPASRSAAPTAGRSHGSRRSRTRPTRLSMPRRTPNLLSAPPTRLLPQRKPRSPAQAAP